MRLVKITVPAGLGEKIKETAFAVGIRSLTVDQATAYLDNGDSRPVENVDIETSTPKAHRFVNKLLAEDYYDSSTVSIAIRQPRSIISDEDVYELTTPLVEPATDLYDELWQFSRLTYGLLGRIFIAAALLAYGLIEAKLLLVVGGLLFLPVLPMVMAVSYGLAGKQWRLVWQGALSFICSTVVLFVGGVAVAALSSPPMRSDESGISLLVGISISAAVGVAAALASIDDAGRRELIGLAAASQIGVIPVWFGIVLVLGMPPGSGIHEAYTRGISFGANLAALIAAIMLVQLATGVVGNISRLETPRTREN